MKIALSLVPLVLLCFAAPANAVVLRGVVSEVTDGESMVIISNRQKLTVVLKGVDAPELAQAFGDVARQHLASLILNKPVEVDFSELRAGHVVGKVICNQVDIGLQLIRDGVAWYDRKSLDNLAEAERGGYVAAEQAARRDLLGLWQDGTQMPPWEWRRAQAAKQAGTVTYKNGHGRSLQAEDTLFKSQPAARTPGNSKGRSALAKPSVKPLNTPGQDYDFSPYLTQGRVSIVYFYADWCPACRKLGPDMDAINAQPQIQVLFMNIGDWNTPITQQYGITSVPHLKVYDKSGNLIVEGRDARIWLEEALR